MCLSAWSACLSVCRMNIDELADQIARVPLVCQPGEYFYYGWSYDVSNSAAHHALFSCG